MHAGSAVTFVALSVNPVGGLAVSIPFGVLRMHYPGWLVVVLGVPLAYVQVLVVDFGWSTLGRMAWWRRLLERRRSARLERWLVTSRYTFFTTMLLAPLIGPWLVMAVMRYAQVPQRRVALPILLGITVMATLWVVGCTTLPALFRRG
jgi:hypothetical protein